MSGRVGRREITVGNLVAAGPDAPVLTRLVSVNPIYASFNADEGVVARAFATLSPEADASAHVEQIPVEMSTAANDGAWWKGQLQLIDNQVDVTSGTVRLRASFDNRDGRLIAGQFVRVRMAQPRSAPILAVAERAIGTDRCRTIFASLRAASTPAIASSSTAFSALSQATKSRPSPLLLDGRPLPEAHADAGKASNGAQQ